MLCLQRYFVILLLYAMVSGCTSKKNLVYFQGSDSSKVTSNYNVVFQKDDLLSVTVMGLDQDAVVPFNLPTALLYPSNIGGYAQGAPTPPGYLVDGEGYIDFPIIGKIKFGGLTRTEAAEELKKRLAEYIAKPSVNIRILNFKITVLGEVRNPGTFTIPNERVTLPEAIGIAGDLLITGVRKNALVIRDVNGIKTETRLDLTSKDIFNSPVYYLQQNDIVYIEPNKAKVNSSVVNASNVGVAISVLSLLITLATFLTRVPS